MAETKKSKDNLSFWKSVGTTNVAATREVSMGRRKFTAIDAYSQIMQATEKFGMYGTGWGVRDSEFKVIMDELLVYKAILFYVNEDGKEGLIPIESSTNMYMGSGEKRKLDDDCIKKVGTDALTKGLSKLGFNADVFLGKFDDNKYVADLKENQAKEASASLKDELIAELGITTDNERVKAIWAGNPALKKDAEFADAVKVANNRTAPKQEPSE
jgi:hypothetical protein